MSWNVRAVGFLPLERSLVQRDLLGRGHYRHSHSTRVFLKDGVLMVETAASRPLGRLSVCHFPVT